MHTHNIYIYTYTYILSGGWNAHPQITAVYRITFFAIPRGGTKHTKHFLGYNADNCGGLLFSFLGQPSEYELGVKFMGYHG